MTELTVSGFLQSSLSKKSDPNPLAGSGLRSTSGGSASGSLPDEDLRSTYPFYTGAGRYLLEMIRHHGKADTHPIFSQYGTSVATVFRQQFSAYARQEPPFRCQLNEPPAKYWSRLTQYEDARLLAVSS